jgi:hypothetical protein
MARRGSDAFQLVAARQVVEVGVGVAQQDVQRELLGVVAEAFAVGGADQVIHARPALGDGFLRSISASMADERWRASSCASASCSAVAWSLAALRSASKALSRR